MCLDRISDPVLWTTEMFYGPGRPLFCLALIEDASLLELFAKQIAFL